MPVDQAVEVSVAATQTAVDAAVQATQVAVDAAVQATPAAVDHVGSVLDTLISIGQGLNPSQGTTLAIIVAVLVVVRMVWKKYKSK